MGKTRLLQSFHSIAMTEKKKARIDRRDACPTGGVGEKKDEIAASLRSSQ